jgi:hypothetical protein
MYPITYARGYMQTISMHHLRVHLILCPNAHISIVLEVYKSTRSTLNLLHQPAPLLLLRILPRCRTFLLHIMLRDDAQKHLIKGCLTDGVVLEAQSLLVSLKLSKETSDALLARLVNAPNGCKCILFASRHPLHGRARCRSVVGYAEAHLAMKAAVFDHSSLEFSGKTTNRVHRSLRRGRSILMHDLNMDSVSELVEVSQRITRQESQRYVTFFRN